MGIEPDETPEAGPSRREALEAAFEAAEAPEPVAAPEPVEAAPADAPEGEAPESKPRTAAEKARDERGRFQPKSATKPAPASTQKLGKDTGAAKPNAMGAAKPTGAPAAPATPPAPGADAPAALKPPASWKPGAREKWAGLPPEVQQEAVRRERETQSALEQSAEARKSWGSFQQAVAPYMGMIQAEGSDPVRAAANLFQTAAALRTAPAPAKAQIVANLVKTFGIDIGMLDQALAGQGPPQGAPPGQGQPQGQFRDPRFDELMARLQNGERARQESVAQQNAREVEEFGGSAEFFEDVRHEMADILEVAARRGVAMSLEDAYSRAVKLHPDVSEVLAQREKAAAATATQATTQRARAAASSVKSRPAGPASAPPTSGRRGALEAAWDAHNR